MRKIFLLLISFVLFISNTACSNDNSKSIENSKENIEILEQKEVGDTKVYKVKVEQPGAPIYYDEKQLEGTINPQAIFEITKDKEGRFTTKPLEINVSSSDEIQVEIPQMWSKVGGRENTFSQLVYIKNNNILYNTACVMDFTVVSPNDIKIELKY